MTDKTDTKTPVVPDIGLPTDEELPKGELTKAGPVTTSAPTTFTTPNIQPTSPTGGPEPGPDKIPPIVGPIIGGITGTIGILSGSSSTPEPQRTQPSRSPDQTRKPNGIPEQPGPKDDAEKIRGIKRQNESAELLSKAGYNVEYQPTITTEDLKKNPSLEQIKDPDFRIEGRIFDCLAPTANRALNIHTKIGEKVTKGQTTRLILNLEDSNVSLNDLKQVLTDTPIRNLDEVIIIKDGRITPFFP